MTTPTTPLMPTTPAPTSHILIAAPAQPAQLLLLFHGVGDSARGMAPLGEFLAQHFPQAAIVSIDSPYPCDFSSGFQWYSIQGATEENRRERVAVEIPRFVQTVRHWQQHFGVPPEATCLVGFSQGAFMSLQATQQPEFLAGRIVALAGRFTAPPGLPTWPVVIHLIHGKADSVVRYQYTVDAAERLLQLGADVTADVLPHVEHEINEEMLQLIIERLTTYVPQRLWKEALEAAQAQNPQAGSA